MPAYSSVGPILVGRATQVGALAATLHRVQDQGDARVVLSSGPAGMGKSRLAAETQRLAARELWVRLEGQYVPDAGVPYMALVSALRRRTRGDGAVRAGRTVRRPRVVSGGPAARGRRTDRSGHHQLPTGGPSRRDLACVGAVVATRRCAAGARGPAQGGRRDIARSGISRTRDRGTASVGRWDLPLRRVHRRHPLSVVLCELSRQRRLDGVALAPLDTDQVRAMISALLDGTEVSFEFALAIADRTEDNPFFIEELVKVLVERGDLYLFSSGWERRELDQYRQHADVTGALVIDRPALVLTTTPTTLG